ncbi:AAA family ATPase [Streptomyces sp. NPDC088197]|uniref:AAA family ATPase n=1 Tax=Streptomyces sp. NPDC088197 TaxID=3365840 RepID=UPI0038003B44
MTEATRSAGRTAARPTPTRRAAVRSRAALMTAARAALGGGAGVLLTGPAGIGRSTLLTALADEHAAAGHRVLRCAPSPAERHLPYVGLIDLLSDVGDTAFADLPPPERDALRAALRRPPAAAGAAPPDPLTLRLALLRLLTALCARSPVLLAVDDVQWLDAPTAALLAFATRRAARLPLTTAVALRADGAAWTGAEGAAVLDVPPMTEREVAELLGGRAVAARVHAESGGNPYVALELTRALGEGETAGPLPVPRSLRESLLGRVSGLTAGARTTVLAASAAERPTVRLLRRAGRENAVAELAEAVRQGVVEPVPDGGAVRFVPPLLARVVYEDAEPDERRRVHTALAAAAGDPVERAHHLASLTPGWDAEVAAALSAAATAARRRGSPATAARLGRLAADRTPPGDAAAETDRLLTAAEDAVAAGDYPLARRIAHEVLHEPPAEPGRPADRVRAWMVIVDSCGQAMAEVADVFPQALEDARDDPRLLAQLHHRMSWRAWMVEGTAVKAHTHAARSAVLARSAGDRRTELSALSQQAAVEFYLGRPEAEDTLAAALAGPQDPRVLFDHNGPVFLKHRRHLLHDRLDDARTELRALVYTVRRRGSAESLCQCLSGLAQVEILRGRCESALDLAHQSLRIAEQGGLSQGPAWYAVALAEAAGGSTERALAAADRARRHSEDDDDQLFLPRALHAEGHVRLLRGETAAAVHALQRARLLETGQGQGDPAMRRWQADLAEALVRSGATDEAADLVAATRAQAARLGRRGLLAVLDRAAALVTEARGDSDAAVAQLGAAVTTLTALPYPLEEGRARLALGRLHARRGDPRAARAALDAAARVFRAARAHPWLALTDAEADRVDRDDRLDRFGGYDGFGGYDRVDPPGRAHDRAAPLTALSDAERRVAALAARGASNREIAATLVISVKTVEAALTRAYRKLSVRSRVDLARVALDHPAADRHEV